MASPSRHIRSLPNSLSFSQFALTMLAAVGAGGNVTALTFAPAAAQHKQKPSAKADHSTVDLPIFSSEGKRIGKVLATGVDDDDQFVLVAEIERPLGLGPIAVAIPTNLFVVKADRIELTITAGEVASRLGRGR
jgi:PRC-barrel domain